MALQVLSAVNKPKDKWGPAKIEDRGTRYKIPTIDEFNMEINGGDPDTIKTPPISDHETTGYTNGIANGVDNTAFDKDHL